MATFQTGPIYLSNLQTVLGGSTPVYFSNYRPNYSPYSSAGIPSVTNTNIALSQFAGKRKALKPGFYYRMYKRPQYAFSAGAGGVGGSQYIYYTGGGGAGGVTITSGFGSTAQSPATAAGAGGSANGGSGGAPGTGFGAGGGGGGLWFGVSALDGGRGADGFVYLSMSSAGETLYTANGTLSLTSVNWINFIIMGGGGGGGNNAANSNSVGGGGGGAGYLRCGSVFVQGNTSITITVGLGGASATDGGTTTLVIGSQTFTAAGGQNGTNQNGGAGSSSGGPGATNTTAGTGASSGNANANTTSQGTGFFGAATTYAYNPGYFADDPTFFNTYREFLGGTTTDMSSLSAATGGYYVAQSGSQYFSVEWFGYFYAPTSGNYSFSTSSDDASYLWIGPTAMNGYTTANALVKNGAIHGVTGITANITLTGGTYYPIRIQFGQNAGGYDEIFSFSGPGIASTSNMTGYVFYPLGTAASFPAESAMMLAYSGINTDGAYYINSGGNSVLTYCLMQSKWAGGGWMMLMKGTRSATFHYSSTYWTDSGTTLNTGDATRNDADAKFDVFNTKPIGDVLALFPDAGTTGGSVSQTEAWSWLVPNYNNSIARVSALTGFSSNSRIMNTYPSPFNFPGYSSSIWSYQSGNNAHIMGGGSILPGNIGTNVRWGFVFNNEFDWASNDAYGGIGMDFVWSTYNTAYGAGDFYGCCGVAGLNRSMRFELYGR